MPPLPLVCLPQVVMVLKKEIMKTQNQDIERAAEYRQVRLLGA
jgi:hypothetical protein